MKIQWFSAAAAAMLLLSGCAFPQTGVESLLAAPLLNEEQNEVYAALVRETGSSIKLLYPQRGENRSAFLLMNLDEEATNEAVAFYQSTTANVTTSIHMAVLDKQDGQWRAVHDISLEGTQVEDVAVMKEGGVFLLAVGLTYASENTSLLKAYQFNGDIMDEVYSEDYQAKLICDMDSDDRDDIVLVRGGTEEAAPFAKLLVYEDGGFAEKGRTATDPTITRYSSIRSGYLKNGQQAVYLDGYRGSAAMTTEILGYTENHGQGHLVNLTYDSLNVQSYPVDRPLGAECADLNNDLIIEVPGLTPMPGYSAEQAGAFYLTTWYNFLDGQFEKVKSSYVNASQGYLLDFPESWEGKVSVRKSAQSNEMLFYEYQAGDDPVKSELLYIRMVKRIEWESGVYEDYEVISSSGGGQIFYLAKIPAGATPALRMSMEEVKRNFSRYY